jgi:uncharacterized protein (DUF58 family)
MRKSGLNRGNCIKFAIAETPEDKCSMKEILKKLHNFEIRIRKAINTRMQGDFHSVFKGSGLEFDDVRPYQYGDDVRAIDWNVSAKGHGAYVKTFKEEKEQNVLFLLDVSASQEIGKEGKQKLDIAREICGVLVLSSIKEGSQTGVLCFSDQREKFLKPAKGLAHAYHIIYTIFKLQPISQKTDLKKGLGLIREIAKKKNVVIVISDFIDEGYEDNLKSLARKHDVVAIHLVDDRETQLPGLGILPLWDKESGKNIWVNTSGRVFQQTIKRNFVEKSENLEQLAKKHQINYVRINTAEDYIPSLIKLFRIRNKIRKSA